jgi:hypothetical protein
MVIENVLVGLILLDEVKCPKAAGQASAGGER